MGFLLLAGIGLGVAGQIGASRAAARQAESQKAMAEYNAALQMREAKQIEARTAFEQTRHAKMGARLMKTMEAGMGAAGVISTEGTPLLIQAEQAAELELKNLMIGYEGAEGATAARSQAALDRMQAKIYGQQAKSAKTAGYIGAGTTLLTGFGSMGYGGGAGTFLSTAKKSQKWLNAPAGFGVAW